MTTVAMFTCDLYAGVVPQMSPPPHDLERLRTTMVDFIVIYIIKEKLETWSSMESYLPTSDRHAASWIFSDGPSKPLGVVKLRYNALKLFFYNVASDSQKS